MEELLSLKWSSHKNSFLQLLSSLRKKSTYTDVTLACDGKLYNAHKMVLSASSDYFNNIFESISCNNPVIVLKDMSTRNLESLLDYMYLGEVSIRQVDLASLIQAAECLKLKGLAVPDAKTFSKSDNKKRSASPSPIVRKKLRESHTKKTADFCDTPVKDDIFHEPPNNIQRANNSPPIMKTESEVFIKEESLPVNEGNDEWNFPCEPKNYAINLDNNVQSYVDASQNNNLTSTFLLNNPINDVENPNTDTFDNQPLLATSSKKYRSKKISCISPERIRSCSYCDKKFACLADLTRHIRIHTGEKPFACPHCSYRANVKCCMDRHMIKHADVNN